MRINSSTGLPDAVRRLRRGLRDVRDRMARCRNRWREVSFAGMAGGDHTALVMITHDGVDQREVEDALHRRWPDLVMKSLEREEPTVLAHIAEKLIATTHFNLFGSVGTILAP